MRIIICFLLIFHSIASYCQEIDNKKVEIIGNVLCNCLNENIGKSHKERLDECTYVLTKGLSVIKSDSIKEIYASRSDTFLQKNCNEYLKLIIEQNKNTDIKVSNVKEFQSKKNKSITLSDRIKNEYYYNDIVGDSILVKFDNSHWMEFSTRNRTSVNFLLNISNSNGNLKFISSDDAFYNDYYAKDENIDFFIIKEEGEENVVVYFKYFNDIVLKKKLKVFKPN